MPTTLSAGVTHSLIQNTVYALPSNKVTVFSTVAIALGNSTATTSMVLMASSTTGIETGAQFIACTTANTFCTIKKT
jgi:ABC-type uncharacterized transport system permease subunit